MTFARILTLGWDAPVFSQKEPTHWQKRQCLGIAAKMAVNAKRAATLGFKLCRAEGEFSPLREGDLLERVWLDILAWKFSQAPQARAILLATGDKPLVEFSHRNPAKQFWGGAMDATTGQLLGKNVMGGFMMKTRAKMREVLV